VGRPSFPAHYFVQSHLSRDFSSALANEDLTAQRSMNDCAHRD
jgi:hypothetical protein